MTQHGRLVLLALAAGCLDATCFLGLQGIFPANQTGNTVLLGIAVGRGDVDAMARSGLALLAFCAGVVALGVALRHRPPPADPAADHAVRAAHWAEAILLTGLLALWATAPVLVLITLAALAMGVQSLVAQRAGVPGVSTTFVTGTLTRLSARLGGGTANADEDRTPLLVWLAYLGGAIAGGAATHLVGGRLGVGVALGLVVVVAAFSPRPARR